MAGIYKIGSKLGYDLANGMAAGQTIRATDGSEWTKNADGSISVLQNGQKLTGEITYQPGTQPQGVQQGAGGALTPESAAAMQGAAGYTSPYAEKLSQVIAGLGDSKWQGWDANSDPAMQAYRKQYLREADRSAEDVLGQYAQNTGGIAGSAAIAAATQASDYYKSQLADKVPQMYENAYARHLNEVAQQQNMAELLMNAESQQQNQYYDRINYAMNKWAQMGYADQEVASILGVAAGTPTSDQSYTNWSTAFQQEQFEYDKNRKYASGIVEQSEEQKQQTSTEKPNVLQINTNEAIRRLVSGMQNYGWSNQQIYDKLKLSGYDDETIDKALSGL